MTASHFDRVVRMGGMIGLDRDNAVRRIGILATIVLAAWELSDGRPTLALGYAVLALGAAVGFAHVVVALLSRRA